MYKLGSCSATTDVTSKREAGTCLDEKQPVKP